MERKFDRRNKIITVVAVIAAAVVAIVAIIMNQPQEITADYFVNDDTKLVNKLDKDVAAYETSEWEPETTYVVYYYSGNKITGVKIYFEYDNEEEAKLADENISMEDKSWALGKSRNGRYVVLNLRRAEYTDLTTDYVRDIIR